MSPAPAVSVIIPAYEPGDLLTRAIDSVLTQAAGDLELIVVDDGSRQDLRWVAGLADPRVRYIRQDNRGVSIARNLGAVLAQAPLVAFLDQDDEWLPDKLGQQLRLVSEVPDAAFWYTWFDWVLPDRVIGGTEVAPTYHGLLDDHMVCLSTSLVRREDYFAVGGHNPLLAQTQDWDLFLRLSMHGRSPAGVRRKLVDYHLHGHNASRDYAEGARERLAILTSHEALARRRGDSAALQAIRRGRRRTREMYGYQAVDALRESLHARDLAGGARHAASVTRLKPTLLLTGAVQAARSRLGGS